MRSMLIATLVALALSACVTDPYHNKVVPSRSSSVQIQAWTVVANKPFQVQCRPYLSGGAWTTVTTLMSGSTPSFTPEQGDLYVINGNMVVPNACWYHWHSQYTTELRFLGGPYTGSGSPQPFSVYDKDGVDCLIDRFFDGESYVDMMDACRLKYSSGGNAESIYVHASGS
jgi:hypothetical protein